jgi:glycosyltransferase involved in cell wall biosynthesis
MRILLVTARPTTSRGGTQALVGGLAGALAANGADVLVASARHGAAGAAVGAPYREVLLDPRGAQPFDRLPPSRQLVSALVLPGLPEVARAFAPDVLLYTPHHTGYAHQAAEVADTVSARLVLWPLVHLDVGTHTHRAARALYRRAGLVVHSSLPEGRWLRDEAGVPPSALLALPCGVAAFAPRAPRTPGPLRLLSVGAYARHKQHDAVIGALRELVRGGLDAHLTIAGTDEHPEVRRELDRLVEKSALGSRVRLRVDAPDDELVSLRREADVFLFASRSESFGLAVLESLACGVPPAVYPHPVYAALVHDAGLGRVAADTTPSALADAVRAVLADPGRSPAADFQLRHSWPDVAARLLGRLGN